MGCRFWVAVCLGLMIAPAAWAHAEDPLEAEFVYTDLDNFWAAFDRFDPADPTSNPFGAHYLDIGTPALADFVPDERIVSAAALAELVGSETAYYALVRPATLRARSFEARIRASYLALEALYPEAVFPPTYYVIGRTTSGGTASPRGLIVAMEVYSDQPTHTAYGRPSFPLEYLPYLTAHELIHFQQQPLDPEPTLLAVAIHEGGADFVSEMISGETVRLLNGPDVYAYGEAHELELWREFRAAMHDPELGEWFYSQTSDGRPQNLGYWMGYQIAQAYYRRSADKRAAIREILRTTDASALLAASDYDGPSQD